MTTEEEKPKVEGKKPRRPTRAYKKDYTSAMAGLEDDTFDIGHPKYATKYERSVDAIARHVQQEYKAGADARYERAHSADCHYAYIPRRPQ